MRFRPTSRLLAVGLALPFALAAVVPAAAAEHAADTPAPTPSEQSAAEQALSDAQALFSGSGSAKERRLSQRHAAGRDATLVLRDLIIHQRDLPTSAERAEAARILARPTDGIPSTGTDDPKYDTTNVGVTCLTHVCVHWIEDSSSNAVAGRDGNLSTIPTQVTTTLSTVEHVYDVEVGTQGYGYHPPLGDSSSTDDGGGSKLDVYLADVGRAGLYGYCTSDDPHADGNFAGTRQVSAYCVLDNDYKASQFPNNTALENLQVTAAHEFFHAVQFSYDYLDDSWFMEGTAAWMEDQLYSSVNDNLQYLDESPQAYPFVPLDYADFASNGDYYGPYGSWVFWRFLSERAGSGSKDDPSIVRQVWEEARTKYSTSALKTVLADRGSSFGAWFTAFGTWSSNPGKYFREGTSYPRPEPDASYTFGRSKTKISTHELDISHMARSFVSFKPSSTLRGSQKLRLHVNLANTSHGSLAQVVVHLRSGALHIHSIRLSSSGYAAKTYGFSPSTVSYVKLDLINASTSFKQCGQHDGDVQESCHGVASYDYQPARFNANLTS